MSEKHKMKMHERKNGGVHSIYRLFSLYKFIVVNIYTTEWRGIYF